MEIYSGMMGIPEVCLFETFYFSHPFRQCDLRCCVHVGQTSSGDVSDIIPVVTAL